MTDKFLTYLRAEKRYSEHTIEAYQRDIKQFIDFLAEASLGGRQWVEGRDACGSEERKQWFDPRAVKTDDIRSWIVDLSKLGRSASSINRKTSSLRTYFRYLRKTGVMDTDPFRGVGMRKMPSKLPTFVPQSKMGNILERLENDFASEDFATRRNAMIIILFYTTGIRVSELQAIRASDFSQNFSELKVKGKGDKERIVPIIDYTRGKIAEYFNGFSLQNICISPDLYLFLNEDKKPVSRNEIYRIVRRELELAGVQGKKSPHVLRHTFATHMIDGGADIRDIQEILGHNSLAATQVYTHNSIAKLKEVYEKAHPRSRTVKGEKIRK